MNQTVEYEQAEPWVAPRMPSPLPSFEDVYDTHVDFVWRTLRRLGVPEALVDDATQDVFVVVHRRLAEFAGRSSTKTWLFSIAHHVCLGYLRSARRRPTEALPELLADTGNLSPLAASVLKEDLRRLYALLDQLDDERRTVFVMVELEELSVPEISEALRVNANTIYTRLRAARQQFNEAIKRQEAQDARRSSWTK